MYYIVVCSTVIVYCLCFSKVVDCVPNKSVYPPEGGEYCLEELRALQYHCNDDDDVMEMTEVIHQDITTNIPVIQACHTH